MASEELYIKEQDVNRFVEELFYVLKHSNSTEGYTSTGKKIDTDFGYVEEFVVQLLDIIEAERK